MLTAMKSDSYKTSNSECFEEEDLIQLAQGVSPRQDEMLQHIAHCRKCASSLRKHLHVFADGPWSCAETAILDQLECSEAEEQAWLREHVFNVKTGYANNTRLPAGQSTRVRPPSLWKAALGLSAAALVFGVGYITVPLAMARLEFSGAEKKLAAAWVECRSAEIRFPGAPYASTHPRPQIQGETSSVLEFKRPALLEADAAISHNLNSRDPRWLQLEGRVLLLRANPAEAANMFKSAEARGLTSPSLLIDLANAYFERELDAHPDHPNLQQTIDLLNRVLHIPRLGRDESLVALFNLAIAYEKTNAWDLARQTWNEYLSQDPSGAWADEARRRRDNAQARSASTTEQDPASPEFFLGRLFQNELKPQDPERYQRNALVLWMPHALEDRESNEYLAVTKLADEIKKKLPICG